MKWKAVLVVVGVVGAGVEGRVGEVVHNFAHSRQEDAPHEGCCPLDFMRNVGRGWVLVAAMGVMRFVAFTRSMVALCRRSSRRAWEVELEGR